MDSTGCRMVVWFAVVCLVAAVGCAAEVGEPAPEPFDDDNSASWPDEPVLDTSSAGLGVTEPVRIRGGEWWGNVATPHENQIWTDVRNAIPGRNLTAPFTLQWSCELPRFADAAQNIRLTQTHVGLTPLAMPIQISSPEPGRVYSVTIDPARFEPGWVEVRVRCQGVAQSGTFAGIRQFVSVTFPLQIRGGSTTRCCHAGPGDGSHNHAWYDNDIGYLYPGIRHLPTITGHSIHGAVDLDLVTRASGDLSLAHFKVMVDDVVLREIFGSGTGSQHYTLDTTRLTDGAHVLQFHSHGLSTGFASGNQLASQIEVPIVVDN